METLSQLHFVNDFFIRDSQEKDKFIESCGFALRHCQCGAISQQLIEDLAYLENKITSHEYKSLISRNLVCQEDYQVENPQLDSNAAAVEPKTEVLPAEDVQFEVLQTEEPAQDAVVLTDLHQHQQYEEDYTDLADSAEMSVSSVEPAIRTTTLPTYPGTPAPAVIDMSVHVEDASEGDIAAALDTLNAVAIVTGDSGPVVVYERLDDEGQVIVVTSEQSVELQEENSEIRVLAETASLQDPISNGLTESGSIPDKMEVFATKEEEHELLQKITQPIQVKDSGYDDKVFHCYICEKAYSKQQSLKDHMITHDKSRREKFKCTICGKGFPKPYMVKSHMETHNRLKPFQCNLCGKKFAQKSCLTRHMKIHNKEKPYSCTICKKRFNQYGHAKKHMAMHSDARHKCHLCPRTFPTSEKLDNHLALHDKLAKKKSAETLSDIPVYFKQLTNRDSTLLKHSCKYCPERFASKAELEAHDETHAAERPYQCDICGLRCIKEKNLKFHKNSHTKNANCICEICGRSFRSAYWLSNHLLQHKGVKQFMCEDCGQVFTVQSNLTRHRVKYHNHQPNRKCRTCGQVFSSFKELKYHRSKVHRNEKQLYGCKICGEKFSLIYALVKHHESHLEGKKKEQNGDAVTDGEDPGEENTPTRSSTRLTSKRCKTKETDVTDAEITGVCDKDSKLKKPCPLCGKMLHPTSLYKHIRYHDGPRNSKKPFTKSGQRRKPCPVCKMFISETTVYTHMRIHKRKGEIPDKDDKVDDGKLRKPCDVCGKLCTPQSLPKHKILHLPVRPYSCDICGKRFNQKPHVSRHKKTQHPGK